MSRIINRNPDLVSAKLMSKVRAVIADVDGHLPTGYRLELFEGWRDPRDQADLVKAGFSRTLRSKHSISPARAADVMFQHQLKDGSWKWLAWSVVAELWKRWIHNSKIAHRVSRDGLEWDTPHCELKR